MLPKGTALGQMVASVGQVECHLTVNDLLSMRPNAMAVIVMTKKNRRKSESELTVRNEI